MRTGLVPGVDLGLQFIALGQQRFVSGREPGEHIGHAGPEWPRVHAQRRQDIVLDEASENISDL
jgi:hypothetical protein